MTGDGPFPLSYAQDRVWFTSQLAPDVRLFNLVGGIRFPGPLDIAELERRATMAIRRHDALRMSVQVIDDAPMSLIAPATRVRVPVLDRSSADQASVDEIAREAVLEIGSAPYQLDRAPLWRLALVRLPGGEQMLAMGAHHIVLDGPSLALLGHEVLVPAARPEPPIRYTDFAAWQKSLPQDGVIARELDYWRRELETLPPPLDLTPGLPRPARRSLRGATVTADVPDELLGRIRKLGKDEGVTPYVVFLSAFITLLHRYTGLDDILVGTSVSGRTLPELHSLLGMFVNMLPLRARLSGELTFRALLAQASQTLTAAQSRSAVPFELLVSDLRLGGGRSYPPLVQVGFNMPMPAIPTEVRNVMVRVVDIPYTPEGSQLDLTVHVQSGGASGLQVLFEYASDLFAKSAIDRMIAQYVLVLDELTCDPGRSITDVLLLRATERAALISGRGPAADERAPAQTTVPATPLHRLVAEQARRTPANVAVISGRERLSYAGLTRQADALADELRQRGVRPETLVGVYLQPGLSLPVALLAVWQAGGAYVPLDPGLPAGRIGQILADTGVPVVLTRRDLAGSLPAGRHEVLCVDETPSAVRPVSPAPVSVANAAYVIYTSGSTGRPKGVIVTHGGIANRVLWTIRAHRLGRADRVLQRTRLAFDAAGWEMFAPLVIGGTVVMAPAGTDSDPRAVLGTIGDHQVTVLQVVPSILRMLVEEGDWSRCRSLRLLFSAGEPLDAELCARVRELTGAEIVNTYGPAECAIDATAASIDSAERAGKVPIGRPIDNMRALVLDPSLLPVPIGLSGELYLGGMGVGRGYHGHPELTAAAFVADPYGPPGSRVYRTGDLARWREDGNLEFLGRRDHQVKISGVRVELGEIEAVLTGHHAVRAAVVTAPDDGVGGRRLVAYVVGDASHDELRSYLRERLPAVMVPGIFRTMPALPRTAGGKVDRAALVPPDLSWRPADAVYLPPRNHVEQAVAMAWAELLQVTQIGVRDDFFALGGQSLLLTRLASRLRTLLGAELSVADLFGAPTIETQARLVSASRPAELQQIRPVGRTGPLPLSAGQGRLWFLHQMDPQDVSYNVPIALLLTGELDPAALRATLDELVARHEILRTTIETGSDGIGRQVIHPPAPLPLAEADLTGLDQARAEAGRLIRADGVRPFDLAAGPVLRAQLIRLGPRQHVLGITIHHIASDGWSAGVLRRELAVLYTAYRSGARRPLDPLPIQYGDYAAWQQGFLTGERVRQQLDYWRERLAGLTSVRLPANRPRPARVSPVSGFCMFTIPAEMTGRLRALGRRAGTTLFMTLLAGFQTLLARYTGQDDIVVGTAIGGRTCPGTEDLIGFFANSLALRTDLSGDPTVLELLARVREVALGAYAHQDLPFERLVEELRPDRDLSRHPIFQIMFEMMADEPDVPLEDLQTESLLEELTGRAPKFDLTLWMAERGDGSLLGSVEYAPDLFDAATIERMLRHFRAVLTGFVTEPGQRLGDVPMLSSAEQAQLTAWSTGPGFDPAPAELVPALFAARARAAPDAVAAIAADRRITYAELDARANRLAHRLRADGVRAETVVGICLPAGIEFIVAVLAVLKAGGAYLPLDPDHPAGRLAYMLGEAAAAAVITTGDFCDRLPAEGPAVLALDDPMVMAALSQFADSVPPNGLSPASAAYVLYTSGSSGMPKAVLVEHRALARSVAARLRYYADPVQTFLLLSPVIFDSSIAGIFWTLCTGGTLLIPRPGPKLADEIAGDVLRYQVTHMLAVPSLLAQLTEAQARLSAGPLHPLRVVISAGEACPAGLAERLSALAPSAALVNEYGPTEASVWATAAAIEPGGTPLIGAPVTGTDCHVLDAALRPVPPGVTGELYIGGPGLARGYPNQPALTATRFVPDLLAGGGSRLYRTGDLASWRPDGQLAFHGRIDDQVKISGYRVEPGEVEAVLRAHLMVRRAVVTGWVGQDGNRLLVAYLVDTDPVSPATDEQLRDHCRARLPGYLVPSLFVHLDAFPLTGTGKVDRGAMPDPRAVRRGGTRAGAAPRTAVEEQIARIWHEVLGGSTPGIHDDFFALGGHSLHAVRIAARLQDVFDVELPVRRLFESTTVAELAAVVEQAVAAEIAELSDGEVAAMLAERDTQGPK